MAIGPGKYDDVCTDVRKQTNASGVLVVIIGGNEGHGMSVQADLETTLALPAMLRSVADQIEQEGIVAAGGGHA